MIDHDDEQSHCLAGHDVQDLPVVREAIERAKDAFKQPFVYEASEDLEELLRAAVEIFDEARRVSLSPTDLQTVAGSARTPAELDELSRQVARAAQELVAPPGARRNVSDWEGLFESLVVSVESPYIYHALEALWARKFAINTCGMTERSVALASSVLQARPADRIMRYIHRLCRCVILGLHPEMVILCRSILERTVDDTFERKSVPLPATAAGNSSMRAKLDFAVLAKWLTAKGRDGAWVVWRRGNEAIHEDIGDADSVSWETLRTTISVLRELVEA